MMSFNVEKLTPVDIVVFKAMEFTAPPLMYLPIGLGTALVGGIVMRTDFMKKRLGNEKKEEFSEDEPPKGATGYKRRSER